MQRLKLFVPLFVFGVLAVLFWRGLSLDPSAMPSARIDSEVPVFSLPTLRNPEERITEDVLKQGEVSLLNVWGTWCAACRIEHPFLVKLAEEGLPIYGVNYKDDVDEAVNWLEQLHDPYRLSVVDADGRLGVDLGVFGAPETYVVDKQGVIRYRHVGVVDQRIWDEKLGPLVERLRGE